jgi:hypothetical protein
MDNQTKKPDQDQPETGQPAPSPAPESESALQTSQPSKPEVLKDKRKFVEKAIKVLEQSEAMEIRPADAAERLAPPAEPPWTLQQFFNGEIDLEVELATRFSSMPVMSVIKFRTLGTRTGRGVTTLLTQDGAAQIIIDLDKQTRVMQVSFTFGSMLTLRFVLRDLVDRTRWLELMRRKEGGLAFLWGPTRWENDYTICISRKYYTNFFAFSPNGFEAAARFTPAITQKLLDWIEKHWADDDDPDEAPPQMLTW